MELKKVKLVRFYSGGKENKEVPWTDYDLPKRERSSSVGCKAPIPPTTLPKYVGGPAIGGNTIMDFIKFGKSKLFTEDSELWKNRILDPGSDIVLQWNWIFIVSCLVALFIDPLYFYLPTVGGSKKSLCIRTDLNLRIVVTCFRTVADFFYFLHILLKFHTAYAAPNTRVFGRGELITDPTKISRRYMRKDFYIDLIAALPLPQIMIWFIIPATRSPRTEHKNNALALIVLLQYIPRLYLIFPLSSEIIKATGLVTKTAWAGAAYNLLLYMLASHVLGAAWYLLSVDRYMSCWKSYCRKDAMCTLSYLDCDAFGLANRTAWAGHTLMFDNCLPGDTNAFMYGIFESAVKKGVVTSGFLRKYLYCLWWGLQQLSSYGQNLSTTTYMGETSFAILIAISGLVLFAHLIGNVQTYLQSLTVRLEEWRLKRRDTEEWMRHRQLPDDLRHRVRRFVQYKWLATRGVDEESVLRGLPSDLRRDVQRHLCLDLVRRVPFFSQMDCQLLDAICGHLVSSLCTDGTYIVREGDPVNEMLFIIRGRLESSTTNGGRTGFFNSTTLRPGDFCGEELLSWALHPKPPLNLPCSTRTVRALIEVEAFALRADDLRSVAGQFRRLHSRKLQHTFRYYSHHWRAWAACFIQVAWRRFHKRIAARVLLSLESFGDDATTSGVSSRARLHLGATILASRFAANTRRGAASVAVTQKVIAVVPDLSMLQKPDEPDFSVDAGDGR